MHDDKQIDDLFLRDAYYDVEVEMLRRNITEEFDIMLIADEVSDKWGLNMYQQTALKTLIVIRLF